VKKTAYEGLVRTGRGTWARERVYTSGNRVCFTAIRALQEFERDAVFSFSMSKAIIN